ncbi:MAG: replicative DNA helicase [Phycisphaerales bacterium]|nr:MAG: replicative DNA helicase [Phycisphaerales bacterium]
MPVMTDQNFPRRNGAIDRAREVAAEYQKLFDALPPHSREAEMALLGSLLLDPGVVSDVVTIIERPESFYLESHAAIYKAVRDVDDATSGSDLVQIVERLRNRGQLEGVGGAEYLVELAESVPSAANAVYYARIVRDKARLRSLIDAAARILYEAHATKDDDSETVERLVDDAEKVIFDVARADARTDPQQLVDLLHAELELLEHLEKHGAGGKPTGFDDLDEMLGGLHEGELIILAARPSMGKTAIALNLAEQIALGGRTPLSPRSAGGEMVPVGFFSLEMSKSAVVQRLISAYSGLDSHRLRTGQFSKSEFDDRIVGACATLSEAPIFIDDTPALTLAGLRARARRMHRQHGVRVIMIDYLQLLSAPGAAKESRQVEVSTISRGIKALARELEVPIVCLAQLNRGAEQREGNRPRMSDLRESGSIEQDADVVALLHREDYYHVNDPDWADNHPEKVGLAELIIAKQRNGPTGVVRLTWDSATVRFKNYAGYRDDFDVYTGADEPPMPDASRGAAPFDADAPKTGAGGAFGSRPRTGPAHNHRDGGGPDEDTDNLPI